MSSISVPDIVDIWRPHARARNISFVRILANTDEIIGRTYDKVPRMLKMPCGARGPAAALEEFCRKEIDGPAERPTLEIRPFSVPMPAQVAFSFSGLHAIQDGAGRQLSDRLLQCHSILREEGSDMTCRC